MKHNFALIFTIILVALMAVAITTGALLEKNKNGAVSSAQEEPAPKESGEAVDKEPEEAPEPVTLPEAEKGQEENSGQVDVSGPEVEAEPEPEPEPEKVPLDKYRELLAINPYVAGWLSVDGSKINDPVVYTPGSQNYFLHRDVDGTPLEKGTFFIAINWHEGCNNTLIYGHNMKDGSGFGSLLKFADKNYGLTHPVIRFDTLYEDREYELLGAFYSQIDEEELETDDDRKEADKKIADASIAKKQEEGESVSAKELTVKDLDLHREFEVADIYREEKDEDNGRFRYYYYTDLSDKADFDYFVNNVKERELYDTGVDAEWGDDLLTLSTCSYQVKNGRFIVVAVRHRDEN